MPNRTIVLKGTGIRKERVGLGAITPGELVSINSSDQYIRHAVAQGNARKIFVVEDDLQGNDIDDDYITLNQVQANVMHSGEEVYAWLAILENVAIGAALVSAGNGQLQAYVAPVSAEGSPLYTETHDSNVIVAYALEAVDLSTSGTAKSRIEVEIA
ncbi:hypothetical protein LCGC14_0982980 [marine sediment metagenome]|uniref:Uncharacterized protein n=1 Tax=marine sediment metagenome TaxID=412755 RepID=A0A0F9N827_9ZZZZ